jgi:hypothetical protein
VIKIASTYGILTVANLEALMGGRDLGTEDDRYTDTVVESACISRAEVKVFGIIQNTWTSGTIQDNVKSAIEDWAVHYCELMLIRDGHWDNEFPSPSQTESFLTAMTEELIEPEKDNYKNKKNVFVVKRTTNVID